MPVEILFPKVSLELDSGTVSRWLVREGDAVTAGQVLFEIENDKAAVEVDAPADGTIRGLIPEGREVDVGAPVARILQAGEVDAPVTAAPAATVAKPAQAAAAAPAVQRAGRAGPNPTPLARRIARENGISLEGLAGTGPHGRVQRKDVLAHLAGLAAAPARPREPAPSGDGLHGKWLRRGAGLPLVLLHGYSADLNNWRGLFAGAGDAPPAFALDLPGHGASPREIPASLDDMAEQVEARLAEEGIGPMLLVGHSFGGALAARIAARGVADARALALISPAGLGPEINEGFTSGILRASRAESLRPWLEVLVHDPAVISDAFVKAVVSAREDEGLTAAMQAFAAQVFPDGTQSFSIRGDLAALSLPARIIFGRHDRVLPFATTRDLPGHVALHALSDCGHMPHLEHPALLRRILAEMRKAAE